MLGVKWFHTHTRILHVTTATTPPAAMTPASWFMGCERVMGWRGGAVLFYDNAVPLYSHKWREWETKSTGEERESRLNLPSTHVGVFFFPSLCLLSDMVLLFQPTGSTCRQNGNLYCNNCSKLRVHLWKGSDARRNSSDSWWIRISIIPLTEDYKSVRTVYDAYQQIRQHIFAICLWIKKWKVKL